MPVDKLSISLPADLARELDNLAAQDGVSRSSLVREATARYVASRASDAEVARHRASVDTAVARFDHVAALWGDDARPGVEYLDDIRSYTPHEVRDPDGE